MFPIHSAHIDSFRGIRDLEFPLHSRATVIFGASAAGKTALCDALTVGLGAIGARMPRTCARDFRRSDFRISPDGETAALTSVTIRASNNLAWQVSQKRDRTVSMPADYLGRRALHAWLDPRITAIQQDFDNRRVILPVVASYGTDRSVIDLPNRLPDDDFTRLTGLEYSSKSPSRFEGAFQWFLVQEDEERRARMERQDLEYRLPELEWFRRALAAAFPAFSNPRTITRPLRLVIDFGGKHGVAPERDLRELPPDYLRHFALIADITRRCVQLNPSDDLGSPIRGTRSAGIVVIDEIERHLPPACQGAVLGSLSAAFPNLQLVATTRSEEVVGSVAPDQAFEIEHREGEVRVAPRRIRPPARSADSHPPAPTP